MERSVRNVGSELSEHEEQLVDRLAQLFKNDKWALNYFSIHKYRVFDDLKFLSSISTEGKILNIGGAPYLFEVAARELGFKCSSFDINKERFADQISALDLDVVSTNVETDEFVPSVLNDYEIVVMCEIFEHFRIDLLKTMRTVFEGLSERSYLYLTTPNFFYKPVFMERFLSQRSGPSPIKEWSKLTQLGHMGHVREYSLVELVEIFRAIGFKPLFIQARNSRGVTGAKSFDLSDARQIWQFEAETSPLAAQEFMFLLQK